MDQEVLKHVSLVYKQFILALASFYSRAVFCFIDKLYVNNTFCIPRVGMPRVLLFFLPPRGIKCQEKECEITEGGGVERVGMGDQ